MPACAQLWRLNRKIVFTNLPPSHEEGKYVWNVLNIEVMEPYNLSLIKGVILVQLSRSPSDDLVQIRMNT